MIKIYFDMDGTVADFYGQKDWLAKLENEEPGAFINCAPLFGDKFLKMVNKCLEQGIQFGIITWLPMQASVEYEKICEQEKKDWVKEHMPFITDFCALSYGTPKQYGIKKHVANEILIDDNTDVIERWNTKRRRIGYLVDCMEDVTQLLEQVMDDFDIDID